MEFGINDLLATAEERMRSRPVYLNEAGDSDFMARAYFRRESDDDRVVLIAYGADRDSAYSKLSANLDLYAGDYELVDMEG